MTQPSGSPGGTTAAPERILVIHLAGFGDLLMGLPALEALRQARPSSRIVLLTWARHREAAQRIAGIDAWVVLDEGCGPRALRRNGAAIRALRAQRFDLAINLYQVWRRVGVWKLAALLSLIQPRRTAGRDTDGKGWCFDVRIPETQADGRHEVERQLAVIQALTGKSARASNARSRLRLDPDEEKTLTDWLTQKGIAPEEKLLLIHAGSGRPAHRWPWTSFAELARLLEDRHRCRVVLIGTRGERALAERIAAKLRSPVVASGELSFGLLAQLFLRARLLLTNDSGPMHLAACLGIPLVAVTGPGDPRRFGPYPATRENQVVIYAADCGVCYRADCRGHAALRGLPISVVAEPVEALLNGERRSGIVRVAKPVKVLHVHTLPVVSGSGINTFLCMKGQHDAGFDVSLACAPGGALLERVTENGMKVFPLKHMVWPLHPIQDPLVVGELFRLMRREGFAVVHTHNSKAGFLGRLAARLARVPVVVHTVHGFAFHDAEKPWKRMFYRTAERLAARLCDKLIVISQPLIEWAVKEKIAPRSRMVKIYSGIEVEAFGKPVDCAALRRSLGLSSEDFVVGEVAKLWPGKGHDVLFGAAARLRNFIPNLKILLIGDGGLRSQLERLAHELKLDGRVVFAGFRSDVAALTQILDVAVLPSLFEGMGRAVVEAQAAGKPVIGTRVGGIPDLILNGVTGLLVEPNHVEALAWAIEKLAADPALRAQMGRNARSAVDERLSARHMSEKTIEIYRALLREKGKPSAV